MCVIFIQGLKREIKILSKVRINIKIRKLTKIKLFRLSF